MTEKPSEQQAGRTTELAKVLQRMFRGEMVPSEINGELGTVGLFSDDAKIAYASKLLADFALSERRKGMELAAQIAEKQAKSCKGTAVSE